MQYGFQMPHSIRLTIFYIMCIYTLIFPMVLAFTDTMYIFIYCIFFDIDHLVISTNVSLYLVLNVLSSYAIITMYILRSLLYVLTQCIDH